MISFRMSFNDMEVYSSIAPVNAGKRQTGFSLEIQAFIFACAKSESLDLCFGWPGLKVGVNPSRWASLKKIKVFFELVHF